MTNDFYSKNPKIAFFSKLEFQVKGILFALPVAALLIAFLISVGATDLIFPEWFITAIGVTAIISHQLSVHAHFGRFMDLVHLKWKQLKAFIHTFEFTGQTLGILAGLLMLIGFIVARIAIPFLVPLGHIAYIVFGLRQVNVFAGLGNRIGRIFDKKSRPMSEKVPIGVAICIGALLSIILLATSTAAMVSVIGITLFLGPTLPIWIGSIIFILTVSSVFASSTDYASKGVNFIRSFHSKDKEFRAYVARFKFDYGGAMVGTILGAVLGGLTVAALIVFCPHILVGLVGVVAGALIVISVTSLVAAIFSQCGRAIDSFRRIATENADRIAASQIPKDINSTANRVPKPEPELELKPRYRTMHLNNKKKEKPNSPPKSVGQNPSTLFHPKHGTHTKGCKVTPSRPNNLRIN